MNNKKILFCRLVIILLFFTSSNILMAQVESLDELNSVDVNQLSDSQIDSYAKRALQKGYTIDELETIARQRGISESIIIKIKSRYLAVQRGGNSLSTGNQNIDRGTGSFDVTSPNVNQLGKTPGNKSTSSVASNIFGYNLFNSNTLTFAPNLSIPTPQDYILGPGDELILDFWGAAELTTRLTVSQEGMVKPSNTGPIFLNGLSIKQAERKLIDRFSKIYKGLKPGVGNPTIFHQISLGKIRSINVTIVGEINNPGDYILNSLSTVFTALHASGGPNRQGSFRNIRLIRNNSLYATVDLYKFLTEGIKQGDERLRNGDVIIIGIAEKRVQIEGESKKTGLFELNDTESFDDLLKYSGGFNNLADRSVVKVKRLSSNGREIKELTPDQFKSFIPLDGDQYEFLPIETAVPFTNRVRILGAVYRPGEYELTKGLTLSQLITKGGGLKGNAFMQRARLTRIKDDFSEDVISIDLTSLLNGSTEDIILQREDFMQIETIDNLKQDLKVQILGQVINPGIFTYKENLSVQELIVLAGGLTDAASGATIEISRRVKNGGLTLNSEIINVEIDEDLTIDENQKEVILKPFDNIYVRKKEGYSVQRKVTIEGEVKIPGAYDIGKNDERISDIIKRCNGLTPFADARGAILIRKTKSSTDIQGNDLKRDIIEDVSRTDPLLDNINITDSEIVVIELSKIMNNPGSKFDLILRADDVISIPRILETVRVTGEVTSTLNLRFDSSKSYKDYINESGGFLRQAKKNRSYIQYANGGYKATRRFLFFNNFPKVEPGATLVVTRKPERKPFSFEKVLGLLSTMVTIALLADRIGN